MKLSETRKRAFVAALLLLIVALSWSAADAAGHLTRDWYTEDVRLRAALAVRAGRSTLVREWSDPSAVRELLEEMTRDERLSSAIVCDTAGTIIARTSEFPTGLGCSGAAGDRHNAVNEFRIGDEHGKPLGVIVMVHDLSYAERRESMARWLAFVALGSFGILILTTMIGAWRNQSRGRAEPLAERPGLAPFISDVRHLTERLSDETQAHPALGWSSRRLRETLTTLFAGERIIIVANREPYIHERQGDRIRTVHPASGLVTALEPVMRACSGVWVAHGSGSADRETSDAKGHVSVPPGEELYTLRRVWLTPEEEAGYYYGFSNEGLWPLCHVAHARPAFRAADFEAYRTVNAKFAVAVVEEMERDDATILVQDYHLALAPALIREAAERATILTFWHIPWPNAERFGICPQHTELLRGLLGSSIIGFHTQQHCNNFLEAVDRYLEARIDRELDAVFFNGHWTLVRAYPISIEWPNRWLDTIPSVEECRRIVRSEHKIGPNVQIGVGIDRIDYTKGIEERLLAVERLFERRPDLRERFTFIQLGAPSRTKITAYRDLNDAIEQLANNINARFGTADWKPIVLHRAHHEPEAVFRYYRAADLCYVSSLHDGMNLVAKEFVAARDDERGVLVLSRFTGAARELTEALLVNPYDLEEASDAFSVALSMSEEEQAERMHALRRYVAEWNVYRWAGRMLTDAARLRQGQRLAGRIGTSRADRGSLSRLERPRTVKALN